MPDGGSSWLLTRAVGRVRAMEMMLLGERLYGPQALEWGLVTRVVPDDGSQVCHVLLKTGERYAVTIHRRGGEHRVTAAEAPER